MISTVQEIVGSRRRAVRAFWDSSVGKKAVMAVTGLIGVGYVILHMIGNLQTFQGAERLNAYAALLHGPLNELLWLARVVLIVAVVLHVVAAWQLTQRDRAARSDRAKVLKRGRTASASSLQIGWLPYSAATAVGFGWLSLRGSSLTAVVQSQ